MGTFIQNAKAWPIPSAVYHSGDVTSPVVEEPVIWEFGVVCVGGHRNLYEQHDMTVL